MRKLNSLVLAAQNKIATKVVEKKNGDSGTVAALILIVIVVGLLITCKTAMANWITTLIGYFDTALNNFTL